MRLNRWVCAVTSVGMVISGALVEEACGTGGSICTTSSGVTTCQIYSESPMDAGKSMMADTGHAVDAPYGEGGPPSDAPPAAFGPGTGTVCTNDAGEFPDAGCDPSDESASQCYPYQTPAMDAGCVFSPKCGNLHTCEPFVKNPEPGTGVDNFRMRLINVTAPAALVSSAIQAGVVTTAIDLPAGLDGGAPCGENGTGLFNWLMEVDKAKGMLTTGGAPPSADPFDLGYCFINGTVNGLSIKPVTTPITFTGSTFSSPPIPGTLNIPIFLPPLPGVPPGIVILPISAISVQDVVISEDGQCIGSVNNNASLPPTPGAACADPGANGVASCSRWHSAGAFGGYITLENANKIPIVALGGISLCVLLTQQTDPSNQKVCPASALTSAGDYCSSPGGTAGHACKGGDSVWMSAQFAASAVNISAGTGVSLCTGGTFGSADAG